MSKWFYSKASQTHGPFSADELKNVAAEGLLQAGDMLWSEGGGRKDARRADAVLDFTRLPRAQAKLPSWLEDVAKNEGKGPVPPPASSPEVPGWLADLRLWYALEMVPARPAATGESVNQVVDDWCNLEWMASTKPPPPRRATRAAPVKTPAPQPTTAAKLPQKSEFPRPVETPPEADLLAERALRETGVDPRTGQILDSDQFKQWKQQHAQSPPSGAQATASIMEIFRQGRIAIERWVDDDDHRPSIMAGNMDRMLKDPDLAGILQKYGDHGPVMKDKLLKHLAFMVDNRREYYSACPV